MSGSKDKGPIKGRSGLTVEEERKLSAESLGESEEVVE